MEQEIGSWDSVLLENLSEESFINNLHQRYKRDLIYVSCSLLPCIFVRDYLGLICVLLMPLFARFRRTSVHFWWR